MSRADATHPAALWGIAGILLLLGQAVVRLAPLAWEPIAKGLLGPVEAAIYAATLVFFAYTEGWRGFHLRFSPRAVARALTLRQRGRTIDWLLAPAYCMALFRAPRRRLITSWVLLVMIIAVVIAVRSLPPLWRGIVDGGVVVGLSVGAASLLWHFGRALYGMAPPMSAELPTSDAALAQP